jgi:ribosomal protein S18 acetylase RimI-like enzyme
VEIKKGKVEDIPKIMSVIKLAVSDMEDQGVYQWDDIYPNEEIITEDINEENLYTYVDENIIKGFFVLNEYQDKEYAELDWQYKAGKHLVIHRLCVSPKYKGKGIATSLIEYADEYGRRNKYSAIRLDTFIDNKRACSLYDKEGYSVVGTVVFKKGVFYCFEKKL